MKEYKKIETKKKERKKVKKRWVIGVIAAVLAVAAVGCGSKENGTGDSAKADISSSADVLNNVLDSYGEDDKFPMMGGDLENMTDGKAGIYSLSDAEGLTSTLHVTEELTAQVDEVASVLHAMNANTFTAAAFHLKDAKETVNFAQPLKESILNTQWICGFPEKLLIYTVNDDYAVYVLGEGELVDTFAKKLESVYGKAASVVVDENIE